MLLQKLFVVVAKTLDILLWVLWVTSWGWRCFM